MLVCSLERTIVVFSIYVSFAQPLVWTAIFCCIIGMVKSQEPPLILKAMFVLTG